MMERKRRKYAGDCSKVMATGKWLIVCVAYVVFAMATGAYPQVGGSVVRVKELPRYLGQTVTVKGRTGQILEQYASGTTKAFSLRDDYGDQVIVLTEKPYPVMGITLYITGVPERRQGRIFLLEQSRQRWLAPQVAITELGKYIGGTVRVQGKVSRASNPGGKGTFVLTDEQGHEVSVRAEQVPKNGSVVSAVGMVESDPAAGIILIAESVQLITAPPEGVNMKLLILVAAIAVLLTLAGVYVLIRRRTVEAALPEPWGYAEVLSGPDQGKVFALRYDEVPVGREGDPLTSVVPTDPAVSRQHGRIIRTDSGVFYEHTQGRFGSWVNEQPVQQGQRVPLPQGALIRLGPNTVIRLMPAHAGAGETVLEGRQGVTTGPPEGDERPTQPAQTPPEE